ncbi:MAG: FAD-dependent oxidoreductase [Pseudomonadota bacterium]
MRVVIVGGGQAGASTAATLRQQGHDGEIVLLSNEALAPYERPPLSKSYLLKGSEAQVTSVLPGSHWRDTSTSLRLSEQVLGIDPDAKSVLTGTRSISYDQLVLATGASPRKLPEHLTKGMEGIFYLRSVSDANRLRPELIEGRSLVLIGGGYIGMELAATASQLGVSVTVVERDARILNRVASLQLSGTVRTWHLENDVDLLEDKELKELLGESRVQAVRLSDGTDIPADLVVVGIGATANSELAEKAGLSTDNGILVDAHGRTSHANIWAAGDCASFYQDNRLLRLESVHNAIDQAETVAQNILGAQKQYTPLPTFWSDQYEHVIQIAGLYRSDLSCVLRTASGKTCYWHYLGDRLTAVEVIDDPKTFAIARRLLTDNKSPAPELVGANDTSLKELLKSD